MKADHANKKKGPSPRRRRSGDEDAERRGEAIIRLMSDEKFRLKFAKEIWNEMQRLKRLDKLTQKNGVEPKKRRRS